MTIKITCFICEKDLENDSEEHVVLVTFLASSSVSYTHLDVYKRQGEESDESDLGGVIPPTPSGTSSLIRFPPGTNSSRNVCRGALIFNAIFSCFNFAFDDWRNFIYSIVFRRIADLFSYKLIFY